MVGQVRAGKSMRSVAREHQISLSTVQWWMRRAGDLPLERVDWKTHPPIATTIRRTDATIEDLVVSLRRELKETSDLGEIWGSGDPSRTCRTSS
jgi:transposase-like protein